MRQRQEVQALSRQAELT
ncbi:hypothetical protein LRP76_01060 [Burkholderia pseudomallei]|nr:MULTISPECIES: hypothetical protein [Burkholderia]MCD4517188.1 hypothetical protein [Burkholderia pseudomallei]MCD4551274.1 hypothetical protein [Burkholderia pseudomallei]MCQ8219457.1 hypothetical protein [Burkholderia pseudomallei]MCQ8224378.1 hypothetical protein [Burkholderia pseudomallei]MCS0466424.1 hypothetical protein [Burkholderia mallei]